MYLESWFTTLGIYLMGEQNGTSRGIWWNEYDKVLSFCNRIMSNFKTNFIGIERNTRILVVWSELV